MVVLNRIYTRTGDDGTTALGSGERRPKYDLRIEAYGTVDETNAAIGVVRLHLGEARELDATLGRIQNDLFDLGADLAVPAREGKAERLPVPNNSQDAVVSTTVLCSVHDPGMALQEIVRVLKPGGRAQIADIVISAILPDDALRDIDLWTG